MARGSRPSTARCRPIISNTPTRTASPRWRGRHGRGAAARRVLFPAREADAAGRCVAQARRADRDRDRLQSRHLADHVAAADDEHGGDAVPPDGRGVHCRRDARSRARARAAATSARSKPASAAISRSGTSSGRPSSSIASASIRCMRASGAGVAIPEEGAEEGAIRRRGKHNQECIIKRIVAMDSGSRCRSAGMTGTQMANRLDNTRVIRAPRGSDDQREKLAHRSAAAHADEQPRSGGRREAAGARGLRRHRPRGARLGELRPHRRDAAALEADETLFMQSGKPVGVFRTHADAPRVLIANSNLVPHWATLEKFNELDRKGLMMYGQMTAGSWIYIGSQGIVQGTYETFAELGRRHYGGSSPAAGSSRPASAAWAARNRSPRRWRAPRCWRSSASPRASRCGCGRGYLDSQAGLARRGAGDDRTRLRGEESRSRSA